MTDAEINLSLEQLRGLHLPSDMTSAMQSDIAVAITIGFIAALLLGSIRFPHRWTRITIRHAALTELAMTRGFSLPERLTGQARLLRRIARTVVGETATHEIGLDWAIRLDKIFKTNFFTNGEGRVFTEGLYRPQIPDLEALDAELSRLIRRM